jgi:trehalose/maltose transport system permease protein
MVGESNRNFWFYFQRVGFVVVVTLFAIYSVFPFVWGILNSLNANSDTPQTVTAMLPEQITLNNYGVALTNGIFLRAILNSLLIATGATLLSLALGGLAAYALGRYKFYGRNAMRYLILAMNLFPTIAVLPGLLNIVRDLGLTGNITALIITYPIFTLPTITWSMITFFQRLPYEIEQAAYVDGANTWQLFSRVLLPLSFPVLFTTGVITFVGTFSEYLLALSFVSAEPDSFNVTVAIDFLRGQVSTGELMAMAVVLSVPLLIVIYFTQRQAIKETTEGGVKG